jgi:hypothetical protein
MGHQLVAACIFLIRALAALLTGGTTGTDAGT